MLPSRWEISQAFNISSSRHSRIKKCVLYWYFQTCYWRPLLTQKLPCYKKWLLLLLLSHFSHFWLCVTLWTTACQAPLFMRFSRQEYWSGLPCSPPGDLPAQGWTWVFCNVDSFFITELPGKPFENYFVIKNWNFGKNYILHPHWFTHVTHILLLIISSVEQYITREWMIHTCNSNKQLRCIPCLSLCFTLNDVRQFSYDDYAFWVYSEKPCRRHILYHRWVPLAWAGWRLAQNNRLCFLNL